MKTEDRKLQKLMEDIDTGKLQIPDFQRGWVWDDVRIKDLIFSIIRNFPIGAVMFLEYGNDSIHFKHRPITGSNATPDDEATELILDGQQRLTSLYNAIYSKQPVKMIDKGKEKERFYYIDIEKAIDPNADEEVIISIPETRQVTCDFGRKVEIDLSTRQNEFKLRKFPLNIILNDTEIKEWKKEFFAYHNSNQDVKDQYYDFYEKIIETIKYYVIPIILLDKRTPKRAVCQVFENVNTGGVSLTVFELVTAIFAMDDFQLRKDWEERKERYFSNNLLSIITATDFLTALTLLVTFKSGGTVSCKKKDVLELSLGAYKKYADPLCEGFRSANNLLMEEGIFSSQDLPYSTQLIPLAAICTVLIEEKKFDDANTIRMLKHWYWCGVFGELYGSANETRYANDITQVIKWINEEGDIPKTVTDFFFNPTRLLGLQSRQSAAYKGIMALILKNNPLDFISGRQITFLTFSEEKIDIHHIFPKDYCVGQNYDRKKWNSIINKTPISAKSNRKIGGSAPSVYLEKIEKKLTSCNLHDWMETHLIDYNILRNNKFQDFIIDRAKKLLIAIEQATGRSISGKESDEVRQTFGDSLC